jgi:citrate/tricarballylate utilization protein
VLFGVHTGPGAFYKLMPHNAMAALFGAAFLYAIVALVMGVRAFWRDIGEPIGMSGRRGSLLQAIRDAGELRYLDGGGVGCFNEDDRPTDRRKLYHHLTFYGFALCFASTCVATLYHYLSRARGALSVVGPAGRAGHARRHRPLIGRSACLPSAGKRDTVLVDEARYGWTSRSS